MSLKCGDCVSYEECRRRALEWYAWLGKKPDIAERDASYCARYTTLDELISQYEKENENGL